MSIIVKFNNKVLRLNNKKVGWTAPPDPYNPLNLPAFTIRCRYTEGTQPRNNQGLSIITNQVSVSPNIWDITYNNTNWSNLFKYDSNIIEVLGANTTGVINMSSTFESANILETLVIFDTSSVTNMSRTFATLERLTSLPLYDTSNVTTMYNICGGDSNLTYIPLFNTAKVTDVRYAFQRCKKVETGALALYQQMSTQTNPPTQHSSTFADCGRDTVNGAAELAQIPSNWK